MSFSNDLRRLLAESNGFRAVAESSVHWEVWVDPAGQLLWTSPACRRISGYPAAELLALADPAGTLLHPADQPGLKELLAGRPSRGAGFEFRLIRRDGSTRWVSAAWQPLELDGQAAPGLGLRASLEDITEIRRAGEELQLARQQLEDIVSQRNVELEGQILERKQAESAERDQRTLAEALADSAAAVAATLNLEEVLDRILANVGRVVPHDGGDIRLVAGNQREAHMVRNSYPQAYRSQIEDGSLSLPFSQTYYLPRMFASGRPVLVRNIHSDPNWVRRAGFEWVSSYIAAPLVYRSEVLGFITLLSTVPNFFRPGQDRLLEMFANQAAIALHNARQYEEARDLATWEERQRLAREMHDSVSQTLFSAAVIAESLPLVLKRHPKKIDSSLVELQRLTRGALAEMRTLLVELRPAALIQTDLGDLLRQLVDSLRGRSGLEIALTVDGVGTLPPQLQTAFFRTAQEALNNVVNHAAARSVQIDLFYRPESARLRVSDDGCGFDLQHTRPGRMGLGIMRERAGQAGARLDLDSNPGRGTCLELVWQAQENRCE